MLALFFMPMNARFHSHSSGFAELTAFCDALTGPATPHDQRAFEAILRCVSANLSLSEKDEAERLAQRLFSEAKGFAESVGHLHGSAPQDEPCVESLIQGLECFS